MGLAGSLDKACLPCQLAADLGCCCCSSDIFFARGIARLETLEMSSLSVEEAPGHEIIVTLFEVEATPDSIQVGKRAGVVCVR